MLNRALTAVTLFLLVLLFAAQHTLPQFASAATRDGVSLPDSLTVNNQQLVLNGIGTRKATIFGIRVYVAGLYLPARSSDAEAILSSSIPKFIEMRLVRDVARKDMTEAWKEGFYRNVQDPSRFSAQLDQVIAATSDVREGESIFVTFGPDSVLLQFPRAEKAEIRAPGFGNALLAIWLGADPPDAGLKAGLLGGS